MPDSEDDEKRRRHADAVRRWRSRVRRKAQLFELEAGAFEYNLAVRYAGLREDQITNKVLVSAAMGRLLRKALIALVMQEEGCRKKCDRVTRLAAPQCYAVPMVKPPPISLRIRSSEASRSASKVLRRLEDADRVQRRVKWQAAKAMISIREMLRIAATLPGGDSGVWRRKFEDVQSLLEKVVKGGV
jgi:hypothetical protein